MPFEYDHTSPLHEFILGPVVRWFKMVNGREPEPEDIAYYAPYIPLQGVDDNMVTIKFRTRYDS